MIFQNQHGRAGIGKSAKEKGALFRRKPGLRRAPRGKREEPEESRRAKPRLAVKELALPVHLGVTRKERSALQEALFSIEMEFDETVPQAEKTDSIESACCYEKACRILRDLVQGQEFHLIERLAGEAFSALAKEFPSVRISLTVHKNPPVKGLKGGVSYTCGARFQAKRGRPV